MYTKVLIIKNHVFSAESLTIYHVLCSDEKGTDSISTLGTLFFLKCKWNCFWDKPYKYRFYNCRKDLLKSINKYFNPAWCGFFLKRHPRRGQNKVRSDAHIWSSIRWKKEPEARVRTLTSPILSYRYKPVRRRVRKNNNVWAIIRPFAMVEGKIILPKVLSIISGRSDPMTRYVGSIIVLNCGMKNASPKNTPRVTPICPKRSIENKRHPSYI